MSAPLLCAVDFSELADWTVRFAAAFARLTHAPLTLLHAREHGDGAETPASRLEALARTCGGADLLVHTEFAEGDPAESIVRRAAALRASAIVMGTHGGRGLERLMLGSVAETVLHRAGRPVATLRGPGHAEGPIRKIVCGADLEDPSPLLYAAGLAHRTSAELVIVHAVRDLPEEGGHGLVPSSYGPTLLEEARKSLARAVAPLDASPGRVVPRVIPGSPSRALLRTAEDESADLLVVGVHPHVLGSTTHPIIRGAPCPVLTIPRAAGRAGGDVTG
jgi:nucleotide-binding universal stress UspA family protein